MREKAIFSGTVLARTLTVLCSTSQGVQMYHIGSRRVLFALIAVLAVLPACQSTPTSPGVNPEIVNVPDSFAYQVSSIQNFSGTSTYQWQNSGTTANVNLSAVQSAGGALLVVIDANGIEVFSRSLADNGTFVTAAGAAGMWTVRVVYDSFTGTVNFRTEKTT
jgi:hypothetical protein